MEVAIAIGVVSFALLTTIGLLSSAMLDYGNASQASALTAIHDQVIHDVRQMTWTTSPSVGIPITSPLYFDNQGNQLPAGTTTGAVYKVTVVANTSVNVPSGTSPSVQYTFTDSYNNPTVATVTTSISRYPAITGTALNTYADFVSRN